MEKNAGWKHQRDDMYPRSKRFHVWKRTGYDQKLQSYAGRAKQQEGEAYITTALFSDQCHLFCRHVPIRQAEALTPKEYYAYGNTALFDAIGTVFAEAETEKR